MADAEPRAAGSARKSRGNPAQILSDLWRQGKRPAAEPFLEEHAPLTLAEVVAVLCIDQWERWHINERVRAEAYLQMHPELLAGPEEGFDLVFGEFLLREELDGPPPLDEYLQRFPQYQVLLRKQFELHKAVGSSSEDNISGMLGSESLGAFEPAGPPAKPAQPADWPNVPGYEILGEVGRGGMGRVFKAMHHRLSRVVALKIIRKDRLSQNSELIRRFQREAQAAAKLSHANIVMVFDSDNVNDTYYYAMEYVEGTDLQELIRDSGPLSVEQACDYIRQAALGLQHAHECGLVHRDIKPSNLLVTMPRPTKPAGGVHLLPVRPSKPPALSATGKPIKPLGLSGLGDCPMGIIKILDMGLALIKQSNDSESGQWTLEGTLMGTPDYIAPEQAMNSHEVDIRADMYSLGCTFYFLLTGRPPFGDHPLIKKLMMHQVAEPRPIEELRPEVSPPVCAIIRKLMSKARENRYQTPVELADALAALSRTDLQPKPVEREAFHEAVPPKAIETPPLHAPGASSVRIGDDAIDVPTEVVPPKNIAPAAKMLELPLIMPALSKVKEEDLPPGVTKAQKIAVLEGHRGWVMSVLFSNDRTTLVSGGVDGGLRLWDLNGNEPRDRAVPGAHPGDVSALAFAPDNQLLASGSGQLDGLIRLWGNCAAQPQHRGTIPLRNSTIDALAFARDGRLLACGGSDKQVRIWDVSGAAPVSRFVLKGHGDVIKGLTFIAENQMLVSCSQDGTVRFWDLTRYWSKEKAVLQGGWGQVLKLTVSADNKQLAFGCMDQTVRLWDLTGPTPSARTVLRGHQGIVRLVRFSQDGQRLISVCDGGRVIAWDLATGARDREWLLPRAKIYSLAVTHDGRYLATGNNDGSVFIYRLYPKRNTQN